jgi:hypothetical protein
MKRSAGLVLLEVIVALTILAIGFSVLFVGISQSARNIDKLQRVQQRENSVRNLLSALDLVQQLKVGDAASGSFEDGTRWRMEVQPYIPVTTQIRRGIFRIELRLEWDGQSGVQRKTIETFRRMDTNPFTVARSLEQQLGDLR